jgi:subtilisin family serine protease
VADYTRYLDRALASTSRAARAAVPQLHIRSTYRDAFGGVEAQLPANRVRDLLKVPGVAAVMKDTLQHPLDDATGFIGAATIWPSLGGQDNAGTGTVVGVLDTGIWPESPYFVDRGLAAPPHALSFYGCDFGDGSDSADLGPSFS